MSIYLIDTENTQTRFTPLIPELNQNDSIILFMIKDKHNISIHIDDLLNMNKNDVELSIIGCYSSKAKRIHLAFS